jgi:hypothetical protein
MADDQNEKRHVVSFPEPRVGAAREAEERRRVAKIVRDIEELGWKVEITAESAKSSAAQAGPSGGRVGKPSTPESEPLPIVADMSSAPKEDSPQVGMFATIPASPQAAEDARFKAEEAARKATEGKPRSDAEVREEAERAGADLAQERARSQALERQLAAREDEQKLLAQERARTQELERQLAVRGDATPDRGRSTTASPSDRPASMPAAPDAPGNPEAVRLMAQARLLLDQGKIIAARSVLERAAESGSALALFLLAETYDPASLSAWGIVGRRGSVTKARELYAKAVAGGVHEAEYRLSALR